MCALAALSAESFATNNYLASTYIDNREPLTVSTELDSNENDNVIYFGDVQQNRFWNRLKIHTGSWIYPKKISIDGTVVHNYSLNYLNNESNLGNYVYRVNNASKADRVCLSIKFNNNVKRKMVVHYTPGDLTGDGKVDSCDFIDFRDVFNSVVNGQLSYAADYTGNGVIDSADFIVFRKFFNTGLPDGNCSCDDDDDDDGDDD